MTEKSERLVPFHITLGGVKGRLERRRVRPGTRPRPGCSLQPHSLAEPGKVQLPGS